MFENGFREDFLHHIMPVDPWIFLCFVKIQVIFLFLVFRILYHLTQSFEDNQESPCNDVSQHSAHVCNLQTLVTFTLLRCYPQTGEVFPPSDTLAFRSWDSSRLVLLVKTDAVQTLSHSFFTGWHSSAACPSFSERPQASFPPQGSLSCILLLELLASKKLTAKQQLLQHYLGHMTCGHHLRMCMLGKESLLVTCQKSPDSKRSGKHQEDLKKAEHRNCFMSCGVC